MDTSIIITLIIGVVGIVCSFFLGYVPKVKNTNIKNLQKENLQALQDLEAFLQIEEILINELSAQTGENKHTIKKRVRKDKFSNKDKIKPSYIRNEIEKLKNTLKL